MRIKAIGRLMRDLSGQLAFITGGASGAGLGQARVFGRAGAKICIADIRSDAIGRAVAKLKAEGIEVHGLQFDIMDRTAYAKAADEVEAVFGMPPTIVSNTAGVNSFGPIEHTTFDDFDWLIGVNLGGVVNGCVTFIPRMIASGRPGHIVTVSSIGGFQGSALAGPYAAAKAATINLMEGYRQGLAKYDIGVSVCTPANINSNIAEASKLRPAHLAASGYVEDAQAIASLQSIHQHGMDPDQLAQTILEGIRANAAYIIPYPEVREGLEKRFAQILSAVPSVETDPDGSKCRSDALRNWVAGRARALSRNEGG
ncbi:NAD(P)-dependent dehydrogenase (short-subunit alcohol dehydrogenase family) [Sphingobium sp. B1D7B]|uniref:SDR family NAD(P)-dependent oxidoreductase n=1 Tax=Sphingobium sp. B1D7B TaxID=2940578 RepID=UPI002225796F|nr:SDR family NAD(P)-dependent oxidoreductase [Sphingobium sp. B1D7B]MCW2406862.1 NAD(P)-dependent dehydrogenase (short-subunit alcohol dehydrogenase family) [Sphingobium sp. B1D7B]